MRHELVTARLRISPVSVPAQIKFTVRVSVHPSKLNRRERLARPDTRTNQATASLGGTSRSVHTEHTLHDAKSRRCERFSITLNV